ncbi:hypothetical protein C8Q76DRAFT_290281 [Earliella scabrosa]|nr:hypothetical protein C8Q76DRAFT_290281 [Earliella scabrosa]
MTETSSSSPSPTIPVVERYYALKGRPYSHFQDLELPPEVETYVNALTEIADALGIDDLSFSTYSSAIDRLEADELALARSLLRTHHAEDELTEYLLSTVHEQHLLEKWVATLQTTTDVNAMVPVLERQKAALTTKAKEYQSELDALMSDMPEAPPVSITELANFRKQLKKEEQVLKEKRARVEAFQGLPPNIELARHALQEARDRQMELIRIRERLLGKMVDGVN